MTVHHDVISVPLTAGRDREFRGGLVDGCSRALIESAVLRSGSEWRQEEPVEEGALDVRDLPILDVEVLYGGVLLNHFGHFMLESLGRLWAYDTLRCRDPYVAFHPAYGRVDYWSKRTYARQVLSGFGIPLDRVLLLDRPVRLEQVRIPAQLYGYGMSRNPPQAFVDHMRRFTFRPQVPSGFEGASRVYVSRSGLPDRHGRPIAEQLFEDYLHDQGYAIFHPERYSLYEQLTVYGGAEHLVFCDGAALHGCVLLPDLAARVAVICRRHNPQWDVSGIVDQFRGYGQDVTWIDAVRHQYQFGLEPWDARTFVDWYDVSVRLVEQGFTTAAFAGFLSVDTSELEAAEVHAFVAAIHGDPRFTRYLMGSSREEIRRGRPSTGDEDDA